MLHRAIAAFLAAHGIAHLLGFLSAWRLGEFPDVPYSTWILNGSVDVGDAGIRLVGLLWLAAAAAFVGAAALAWRPATIAGPVTAIAAAGSLLVCTLGLPAAVVGVVIDVAILGALAAQLVGRPAVQRTAAR